jgi:hypothetical protein
MTRELVDSLQKLTASTEFNLIEMSIIDEDIRLIARFFTDGTNMCQYVNHEEPRYFLLRLKLFVTVAQPLIGEKSSHQSYNFGF